MNWVGDILVGAVGWLPPVPMILVLAVLFSAASLLVFRVTSDQEGIRKAKGPLKAHVLGMVIFRHDLRQVFRAAGLALLQSLANLRFMVVPLLVMIVPILLLTVQLDLRLGLRGLRAGETAVVRVHLSELGDPNLVALTGVPGVAVETPGVRVRGGPREVDFRIRALSPGRHQLPVHYGDQRFEKRITVGRTHLLKSPERVRGGVFGLLLHPGEAALPQSGIAAIEVPYRPAGYRFLGIEWSWWALFLLFMVVSLFALKRPFGGRLLVESITSGRLAMFRITALVLVAACVFAAPAFAQEPGDQPAVKEATAQELKHEQKLFKREFDTVDVDFKLDAIIRYSRCVHNSVATHLLKILARDSDDFVKAEAAKGLGNQVLYADKIGRKLVRYLNGDTEPKILAQVIRTLGKLDYRKSWKAMSSLILHEDDGVLVAVFDVWGQWKELRAHRQMQEFWDKQPTSAWSTGSVIIHTGADRATENRLAKKKWQAQFGGRVKQKARPECMKALLKALKNITGKELEKPDDFREWCAGHEEEIEEAERQRD